MKIEEKIKILYNLFKVISLKLEELNCINESIDLGKYIEFREYVKENMTHPDWLGDFSKNDLIYMLNNNSKIWIYYLKEEPICSMMLIPSDENALSKFELDLDYKDVVDYGPMFVNSKYIGNGLQYQMLKVLDEYCINKKYKYAISTIHPDNIYSINSLIKDKFIFFNQKEFKRGLRNIYLKTLDKNYIQKILTFIVKDNKFLLLKGSDEDPQFHESFWYVVTGSVEKEDKCLEDTVRRELKEETNLDLIKISKLPLIFEYESLGKTCVEHAFISYVKEDNIILNEESIDYKWCDIDEFIKLIKWYDNKDKLYKILNENIDNKNK